MYAADWAVSTYRPKDMLRAAYATLAHHLAAVVVGDSIEQYRSVFLV